MGCVHGYSEKVRKVLRVDLVHPATAGEWEEWRCCPSPRSVSMKRLQLIRVSVRVVGQEADGLWVLGYFSWSLT